MSKLAVLTCLAFMAAPAFAGVEAARPQPVAIEVPTADLDLTAPDAIDRLTGRLKIAMREVCGTRPIPRLVTEQLQFDQCKASFTTNRTEHVLLIAFERARKALG